MVQSHRALFQTELLYFFPKALNMFLRNLEKGHLHDTDNNTEKTTLNLKIKNVVFGIPNGYAHRNFWKYPN